MRGRKPVPREIKALRGTLREKKSTPVGEALERLPRAPRRLGKAARRYWQQLGRQLVRLQILRDVDLPAFELLCDWLGRVEEIRAELDRLPPSERYMMHNRGGRVHPLMKVLQQAQAEAMKLAVEFGLTPSSRERARPAGQQSEIDELRELFGFN